MCCRAIKPKLIGVAVIANQCPLFKFEVDQLISPNAHHFEKHSGA